MNSSIINQEPAFILHHRKYRESSQIIDIFTMNFGRISLIAKGSKKASYRHFIQPYQPLLISWSGRGDLKILRDIEANGHSIPNLQGEKLFCGYYINELIIHLTHQYDPHPDIFKLYQNTLKHLTELDDFQVVLRLFEKYLLNLLGFGLILTHDADTGLAIESNTYYRYEIEHGPVNASNDTLVTELIKGAYLLAFANNELDGVECMTAIKRLMRKIIDYYLDGKKLNSRILYAQFKKVSS
ncbi:MAG: DNA repair protein RecO [Methylococcales bacterium]|jgi:DNA repair protein RecO (recombination protein O)|nr:DNA repair protein RecO [Methylococcales bacterium]MBT7409378.1 DNA repair protein RecO [Methylococcales bacterium]